MKTPRRWRSRCSPALTLPMHCTTTPAVASRRRRRAAGGSSRSTSSASASAWSSDTGHASPTAAAWCKTSFTFNDRGTDVPLAGIWKLAPGGRPWHYQAWGFAARGVSLDDRVDLVGDGGGRDSAAGAADGARARAGRFATASGYAPVIGQELLVRRSMAPGPAGARSARARGRSSHRVARSRQLRARRQAACRSSTSPSRSGLGARRLWIDDKGALAALVTRDAEFDHFEAMAPETRPLLDEFVRKRRRRRGRLARRGRARRRRQGGPLALVGARLVDGPARRRSTTPPSSSTAIASSPPGRARRPPVPAGARTIDVAARRHLCPAYGTCTRTSSRWSRPPPISPPASPRCASRQHPAVHHRGARRRRERTRRRAARHRRLSRRQRRQAGARHLRVNSSRGHRAARRSRGQAPAAPR